jgi:hypothetical protein
MVTLYSLGIWGYVLGHQTVHIHSKPHKFVYGQYPVKDPGLSHCICEADLSEHAAYELSKIAVGEQSDQGSRFQVHTRHSKCQGIWQLSTGSATKQPQKTLDLDLLLVCRQIYIEANPILWSTTTWSFQRYDAWRSFIQGRKNNTIQRHTLRRLHLDENMIYKLDSATISRFQQLDVLHIDTSYRGVPNEDVIELKNSEY